MSIKFSELKEYLSRVVRLSICFKDGYYDNYILPSDIPEGKYDEMFIFGIGMVDVEFPLDVYAEPKELPHLISMKDGFFLGCGLEIVVQEDARDIERSNEKELTFRDLKNYLQCGRNFSIVTKEDWSEENYEWRNEIPPKYNDMYVYGIGIEDNPKEYHQIRSAELLDSQLAKKIRIVVSKTPRSFKGK